LGIRVSRRTNGSRSGTKAWRRAPSQRRGKEKEGRKKLTKREESVMWRVRKDKKKKEAEKH
jgi:hypothetical protein